MSLSFGVVLLWWSSLRQFVHDFKMQMFSSSPHQYSHVLFLVDSFSCLLIELFYALLTIGTVATVFILFWLWSSASRYPALYIVRR